MIKAYSQRLSPPFTGQAQIVESDRARAITLDGQNWEIHFIRGAIGDQGSGYVRHGHSYFRVANVKHSWVCKVAEQGAHDGEAVDERILELAKFLVKATLPFPMADQHEYWLLDSVDESPLAFIFSCVEAEQIDTFPDHPEWTALSAAAMPIERNDEETASNLPPVNYQLERLVAIRAGKKPKAKWFRRDKSNEKSFPPLLVKEEWPDEISHSLCQRYIARQSPRLLMLHGLAHENRLRLEQAARANVMEVERFHAVYPEIADTELMSTMRVEARLRGLNKSKIKN